MKINSSFIYLRDMRFHAYHGVMEQERMVGADFVVSLRVGYDLAKAMRSDDVADTLNYADLYDIVLKEMGTPSRLLEHLAGRIVDAVSAKWLGVNSIDLEITKVNPPFGSDSKGAGIELHLINDKTL